MNVLTRVATWSAAVVVVAIAAAACSTSPVNGRHGKSTVSWCGQRLTKPTFIGTEAMQDLDPVHGSPGPAPAKSLLPPAIESDSLELANWSNLILLSLDCAKGVVVRVSRSPYVRTVGEAYDTTHDGLTALLLGRLKTAPSAIEIVVTAFHNGLAVGQVSLDF